MVVEQNPTVNSNEWQKPSPAAIASLQVWMQDTQQVIQDLSGTDPQLSGILAQFWELMDGVVNP